jgi:hypothetical protein
MHVEIHDSARRHGVSDEDIAHAYAHTLAWIEVGDDPLRFLLAGPDLAGNLLELVVLVAGSVELVIHAMKLRPTTASQLLGES